jgi:hypothetical protein
MDLKQISVHTNLFEKNIDYNTISGRAGTADAIIMVAPGLYFGAYDYTFKPECLTKFTHIINCDTEESSTAAAARRTLKFRHMPSLDYEDFPILERWLTTAREFLADATCAYIHCYAGSNRSAALAIALALERTERPFDLLLAEVRAQTSRSILDNSGFVEQLSDLAQAPSKQRHLPDCKC